LKAYQEQREAKEEEKLDLLKLLSENDKDEKYKPLMVLEEL